MMAALTKKYLPLSLGCKSMPLYKTAARLKLEKAGVEVEV